VEDSKTADNLTGAEIAIIGIAAHFLGAKFISIYGFALHHSVM
jgi:hypothetical protein